MWKACCEPVLGIAYPLILESFPSWNWPDPVKRRSFYQKSEKILNNMNARRTITIEKITDERDLDQVVFLENANFSSENRASRQTIVKRFRRYPGCVLLKVNGTIIGYNSYGPIAPSFIDFFGKRPSLILPVQSIINNKKTTGDEYFASISTAINRKSRSGKISIEGRSFSYYGLFKAYFFH